jgi:gamma-glutamyltranspeptidase
VAPDDLKPAMVRYLVGDERIDLLARTLRRGAPVISPDQEAPGEATHLVVSEGNVVSLAQSIGSGATPALVLGGSGPVLAVVSPGGRRTTCALVRVISSVIDRGLSIEEAVAATREALATVDARGKLR